jgi:hypothetical protein
LETHGGPFIVIAITQGHGDGWWDCNGKGHHGHPCSGLRGCKVKADVAERENEAFPTRRRALMNDARTYAPLSKYLSKDAAGDWLRAKAGQRVFYVAPWLGRAAGASMRLARMARIVWAASRGLIPMPRIEDEDREAVAAFIRGPTDARAP